MCIPVEIVCDLLVGNDVASDQGGDKGEGGVAEGKREAEAAVHGVVGEEKVFLEEKSVQSVEDLESSGHDDGGVDGAGLAVDAVQNEEHVQNGQHGHGCAENDELDVDAHEDFVVEAAVVEVDDQVAGVASGVGVGLSAPTGGESEHDD